MNETVTSCVLDVRGLAGAYFAAVDLQLEAGVLLCLFGASGSGKSQFLRALVDLELHRGEVFLHGVEQQQTAAHVWRRKLAYLPESRVGGQRGSGSILRRSQAAMSLPALAWTRRF